MRIVNVEIQGVTSLLQRRFDEYAETENAKATRRMMIKQVVPREEAERAVYKRDNGTFFFPATWIIGAMTEAGANHKMRGSRRSLRFVVPTAVFFVEEDITILNGDGPAKDFEVDSRPVTIPSTKGRIMRHRPRFDQWSARFSLEIDDDLLPLEVAHELLIEGGRRAGIGEFRPNKRGPFGRFAVVLWSISAK